MAESVTSVRERNRERKRLQRERERPPAAPIVYSTEDWQLFLNPDTLPQKAGCYADELPALVLKELVDNALDEGSEVTVTLEGGRWIVRDNGPGLDPNQVPLLFAVNRPLRSSKLKRLPTRGMLGNGLRVVMAWARDVVVETRGVRLTLKVDAATGHTTVVQREDVPHKPGLTVILKGTMQEDADRATEAIGLADHGFTYRGPSLPHWYGAEDFARLLRAAPAGTTVGDVFTDLGLKAPAAFSTLVAHAVAADPVALLRQARRQVAQIAPEEIGGLGPDVYEDHQGYAHKAGVAIERAGGHLPFVAEAHVQCTRVAAADKAASAALTINRSPVLARLYANWEKSKVNLFGCGIALDLSVPAGSYDISLSIITPHLQLASDGKAPDLGAYRKAIASVVVDACKQAHRAVQPDRKMSVKDATWSVMAQAYMTASNNGTLPANARQVMYAARPRILALTGGDKLNDHYFTQTLLPDYIEAHPDEAADWDVVFDDRGALTEPHTGRMVPLGTVQVREYLGERVAPAEPARINSGSMFTTVGPRHRYRNVLFIEKEGFAALLAHAQIAERFDVAVMSTKGMSVTAARMLIDKLARVGVERVLVAHDFDVFGFSIFGTLGTSNRRYRFQNPVRVIDIGLRLDDVEEMGLQAEPYEPKGWEQREVTLVRHGATDREIAFLRMQRVELNAMPSDVFVTFLERKLTAHGVTKVVPADAVLEQHARHVINRALLNKRLDTLRREVNANTARLVLPPDLRRRVDALLKRNPALPWDLAVAEAVKKLAT
jgi:hypothetical protein